MRDHSPGPTIFLHGILRRSGTNHLHQLLLDHPDCVQPVISVREDWFLDRSDPLLRYADELFKIWSNPKWGGTPFPKAEFLREIGSGQLRFLRTGLSGAEEKVLVTKTPSVAHLDRLQQFFPGSKNVILVRDPLDVAASSYNTWKAPVSKTLNEWNSGCHRIHDYAKDPRNDHYILRYEDLIANPVEKLTECLSYLQLDPGVFPWEKIDEAPVLGSSDGGAAFKAVERSGSFQAVGKWMSLPEEQKRLIEKHFDEQCANYFGYAGIGPVSRALNPFPDFRTRMQLGESLQKGPTDAPLDGRLSLGERLGHAKTGVKMILRSLR